MSCEEVDTLRALQALPAGSHDIDLDLNLFGVILLWQYGSAAFAVASSHIIHFQLYQPFWQCCKPNAILHVSGIFEGLVRSCV